MDVVHIQFSTMVSFDISTDGSSDSNTRKLVHLCAIIDTYSCVPYYHICTNLFQSGFHSKQISCIRQIPLLRDETGNSLNLLLSASEDTTVRLSVISHSSVLHTIAVLQSHISSVRALAVCQMHDSVLVFSGGGRAQLKVWKLVIQAAQG
jgi:WD40 repeat protein